LQLECGGRVAGEAGLADQPRRAMHVDRVRVHREPVALGCPVDLDRLGFGQRPPQS
jgi:hypothetical protein